MKTEILDLDVRLIPFTINKEFRGIGTKSIYGVEMIKAKSIWQESQKGAGVKIAVIDSGCDINHESLKNNIIGVRNFKDEDGNIIENKFGYFKNSIISNIHRLNLDIDDLWGDDELDNYYNFDDIER